MIRINIVFDLFFDRFSFFRDIILGKKFLILVIINFIIANGTNDWIFGFAKEGAIASFIILIMRNYILISSTDYRKFP